MSGLVSIGPPAGAATTTPGPNKIVLYGDSITQGTDGHYTWRYRLWQGLQAAGTNVAFVGPLHSLFTLLPTILINSTEYRDPNFDTNHASVAGMTLTNPIWTMSTEAAFYHPKVLVALIGFNDLLRGLATPSQLIDDWRSQITAIRHVDPGVSIVLGEYGETWYSGVTEYDQDLTALATELDQSDERVVATVAPALDIWRDTFDGAHLTTSGEKLEAASVADALGQLGLPSAAAPADPTAVAGYMAPTLAATVSTAGIDLSWPSVDYATSENVLAQNVATGAYGVLKYVTGNSVHLNGVPGQTYKLWLFPVQGWSTLGTFSIPVTVTVPTS